LETWKLSLGLAVNLFPLMHAYIPLNIRSMKINGKKKDRKRSISNHWTSFNFIKNYRSFF